MPKTTQKEKFEDLDISKPGKQLSDAREAMRLTQLEVAEYMKLTPAVIALIDTDQFDKLPPSGYVRGYLRSYAIMVKLDPHTVIEAYNRLEVDAPALQPYSSQPAHQAHSGDLLVRVVTWAIVLLLIGMLGMWWQSNKDDGGTPLTSLNSLMNGNEPTTPAVETGTELSEPAAGLQYTYPIIVHSEPEVTAARELEESMPTPAGETSPAGDASQSAGIPAAIEGQMENLAEVPASELLEGEQAEEESSPVIAETTSPAGMAKLYVQSPNESWIEILDSTGKKLYFNLAVADQVLDLEGIPPFKVLIGNSSGVVVRYNEVDQDISGFSNQGVSRFRINQEGPFRLPENPPIPSEQ